ncbi:MAG TPA: COX15/CtaA family protein, partial [Pseudonocardiaceae bacterium]|nr:COX15/CtaA family protein [Pseudonocardiaceae bacterium]
MSSPTQPTLRRWATASIVVNIAIVVTGGAVRLTDSGLGCPTWPRCTTDSLVPTARLDYHSAIEFGNRMLTYVLTAVAVGTLIAAYRARPMRRDVRRLALWLFIGIPAQAVLGGITVLTDLNPWVVMLHLLISMDLIALATLLRKRLDEGDGPPVALVGPGERRLAVGVLGLTGAVMYLGTIVTGSGPHAGDAQARRTGLDPRLLSLVHGWLVALIVAGTVALWLRTSSLIRRTVALVLAVQVVQGLLGWVQYATGLPRIVVGLHMLGAGLLVVVTVRMVLSLRARPVVESASPSASPSSGV